MRNNSLDEIVKCNIEISSPLSSDSSCENILLVVSAPKTEGTKEITGVITVNKAGDLLDYGYTENDEAYIATNIVFSQTPCPSSVLLIVREYANVEAQEYETIQTTLNRATAVDFYGIHLTEFRSSEDINAAIQWTEANDRLYCFEYTDIENCPVSTFNYYRSFGVYSGNADGFAADSQPKANEYVALAWMSKCFGYDPGTETWHLKELSGITPSVLSATEKTTLNENHINVFLRYMGSSVTVGGYTLAGEWIDIIRFRDWLKRELQQNVFQAIKGSKKVPMTDNGIGMIEGKMTETLLKGQALGGIAPSEFDANGNETPGYTVVVPKASELSAEDKKNRNLTGCRFSAKLLGAIHLAEISGTLIN